MDFETTFQTWRNAAGNACGGKCWWKWWKCQAFSFVDVEEENAKMKFSISTYLGAANTFQVPFGKQ